MGRQEDLDAYEEEYLDRIEKEKQEQHLKKMRKKELEEKLTNLVNSFFGEGS